MDGIPPATGSIGPAEYDCREFRSTYFTLRLGLILAATLVFIAPIAAWVADKELPPSISDSWYTSAQAPFVIGLAAAACLLLVVRGDTLTEQTALNVSGWLGLFVAGVACRPNGDYAEDVIRSNEVAIASLLVLTAVILAARWRMPTEMFGDGWSAPTSGVIACRLALPLLAIVVAVSLVSAPEFLATHMHMPAAWTMFVLLACVAFLRTTWGLRILRRLGDNPVDNSLGQVRGLAGNRDASAGAARNVRFDRLYTLIGSSMLGAPLVVFAVSFSSPRWMLWVEYALLGVFGMFWAVQTREAWVHRVDVT